MFIFLVLKDVTDIVVECHKYDLLFATYRGWPKGLLLSTIILFGCNVEHSLHLGRLRWFEVRL